MAIAAATETSLADEAETAPDLEPDPVLHLRGRSCRCPARQRQRPTAKRENRSATPAGAGYRHA